MSREPEAEQNVLLVSFSLPFDVRVRDKKRSESGVETQREINRNQYINQISD